jgi:hypothetical protein
MPKAASKSITTSRSPSNPNPDAELLAMIQRHDLLWAEWDRIVLVDKNEDDPRTSELSDQCSDLERRIFVTPAHTARGLAAKRRIIKLTNFELYGARRSLA